STSDAHHLTAPDPTGVPAAKAIEFALADAGVTPQDISYVNAHGTSTQLNDAAETTALKRAFGDEQARRIPISSTKSSIGHLLGAAGAVEAVATAMTLTTGVIAPTLGYEEPDPELDLDYVPGEARPLRPTNGGLPVACYAQDGSYLGGSLGERHADTVVRVLQLAGRARIPVVAFVESGGARMQEGTAALAGYGRIFRETVALTGVVPQISVVSGASAGGGAYSPALTDLIVMTDDASMFLTGPGVVFEALGEEIDAAHLGGPRVHER